MSKLPRSRGLHLLLAGLARTALVTVGGLLVWTLLPVVLGWQPSVVMSGSMEPRVSAGDVVVTRSVPADELRPGQVLLVDDPAVHGQRLLHRYERTTADGDLVLRGDANADVDSTPVDPDAVHGVGTLCIPWVGQPAVWAANGRYLPVALTVLGLLALLALARIREDDPADGGAGSGDADGSVRASAPAAPSPEPEVVVEPVGDRRRAAAAVRAATVATVALAAVGTLVGLTSPAGASFTAATTAEAGQLEARTVPTPTDARCAEQGLDVAVSWTSVGPDYHYVATAYTADGRQVGSPRTTAGTSLVYSQGLLGNLLSTDVVVAIQAVPDDAPTWVSAESATQNLRLRLLGLGVACRG